MVRVETFSEGKVKERNEDRFAYSDSTFVIVDGATDKSGRLHDGKTGGEIVAELVSNECLSVGLDGTELVRHLNKKVREKYIELGILEDTADPKFRFMCDFVQARVVSDRVVVTYVGELGFRINGAGVYKQEQQIDIENAERRAKYIAETGDIAGSRESILPFLLGQFEYQNVSGIPLGYGVIDGTETPDEYVKTFEYPLSSVRIITFTKR